MIQQKTLENIEKTKMKRYTPNWTAIRQKMLENIERIKAKGKQKQDTPKQTGPDGGLVNLGNST